MSFQLLRRAVLMVAVFGIGQALFSQQAHSADLYRAFYYNAAGKLLQVEEVPDMDLNNRELLGIDEMPFPTLTNGVIPLFNQNKNVKMSKFATIAVYYTYTPPEPPDRTENVQATPVKVEDLGLVEKRDLKCKKRDGSDTCYYPKRCHCMTGGCCCY